MKRTALFMSISITLIMIMKACLPAPADLGETATQEAGHQVIASPSASPIDQPPTATIEPSATPLPPFILENGQLREFVTGFYYIVEPMGENIEYKLENGVAVAYLHPDSQLFNVPTEGFKIAVRENRSWKFTADTNFAYAIRPDQLKSLEELMRNPGSYPSYSGENLVRHELQVARSGEFVGARLITSPETNLGTLQFVMLNLDRGFNEVLYLEPPEIAFVPTVSNEQPVRWINGKLTVEQVVEILSAHQKTTSTPSDSIPAGNNFYKGVVFTSRLDRWIKDAIGQGNDFETVCRWLGIPDIYDSPTIVDFCRNQHDNPNRKINDTAQFNAHVEQFKLKPEGTPDKITFWDSNVSVLRSDRDFWFFISFSPLVVQQ